MRACPSAPTASHRLSDGARCLVCARVVHGTGPVCFCCRTVASQLRLPLVPLVALTEYRVGDRAHRRLRAYKDASVVEAREASRRELVADLACGCAEWSDGAPKRLGPFAVVTTVPSSARPGGAPAEHLVDGVPVLADRHLRLLVTGRGRGGHLRAGRDVFALAPGVDRGGLVDLPVLVFDDTTTTGAAAQSAAAALRLAGARVVGALVMGRALAPAADTGIPRSSGGRAARTTP